MRHMIGQFIKYSITCIGIIVGLSASGFLLRQELIAIPISYASDIDLSGNFPDKKVTIQNISGVDSNNSDLFFGANKQVEIIKQDEQEQIKKDETINTPVVVQTEPVKTEPVQTEPVKNPVKKVIVPRITYGAKCPAEKDRPGWSSRKNKNHMDEDCCSDYDEWPKPGCAYTVKDFQIMLAGPTSGHKKHK